MARIVKISELLCLAFAAAAAASASGIECGGGSCSDVPVVEADDSKAAAMEASLLQVWNSNVNSVGDRHHSGNDAACEYLAEGASCNVTKHGVLTPGLCRTSKYSGEMKCRAMDMDVVCEHLAEGASCNLAECGAITLGACKANCRGKDKCRPIPDPSERIDACEDLAEGAPCNFTRRGRTKAGTCTTPQHGRIRRCIANPTDGCEYLAEGASCSVTICGAPTPGTCRTNPCTGRTKCRAAYDHGDTNDECDSLAEGDSCTFTKNGVPTAGTCTPTKHGGQMKCRA